MYYYEELLAKSDRQMLQLLFQVVGIWAIWYQQKEEQAENTSLFCRASSKCYFTETQKYRECARMCIYVFCLLTYKLSNL